MSAIEDQNAAVADLKTTAVAVLSKIDELKNNPGNNDTQIAANTAEIVQVKESLNAAIQ